MLLQGCTGESSLVKMLWKFAGLTHVHWKVLQLWLVGRMALMGVQEVLAGTIQQPLLTSRHVWAKLNSKCWEFSNHLDQGHAQPQILLCMNISTEANKAPSPEHSNEILEIILKIPNCVSFYQMVPLNCQGNTWERFTSRSTCHTILGLVH